MTPDERAKLRAFHSRSNLVSPASRTVVRLLDELERVEAERDTLRAAAFEVIASGHDSETITGLCICTDKGHFEALAAVLAGSGQVEAE